MKLDQCICDTLRSHLRAKMHGRVDGGEITITHMIDVVVDFTQTNVLCTLREWVRRIWEMDLYTSQLDSKSI